MNTRHRSSFRLAAALGVTALALAACGGDDDDTDDPAPATTAAPADDTAEPPAEGDAAGASSITFDAQESDGSTIVVAAVELPAAGFVAVHGDGGGSPGPVVGVSGLLPEGASSNVEIALDTPLTEDTTLFPMVHIDTNGNGIYEFGQVEGVDGPGTTATGDVAVVGGAVTVAGSGDDGEGASADAGGDGTAITIADFAFGGVTEVPVGTTVVVTNDDASPHTWTAVEGLFDSGSLAQGDSFEFTFTEAGSFDYFCNFHPSMTGTITVTG